MNRSLIILTMGVVGVMLGTAGLVCYIHKNPPAAEIVLNSDEEMREFLSEYDKTAKDEPPVKLEITLPKECNTSVFGTYCDIQKEQSLPLAEHFGEEVVMWTYTLNDLPTMRAELICTKDGLLVGAMRYDCINFHRMYPIIT